MKVNITMFAIQTSNNIYREPHAYNFRLFASIPKKYTEQKQHKGSLNWGVTFMYINFRLLVSLPTNIFA